MKGIVFREFIDMVELQFSLETADAIIAASTLSTGGAYTAVGTYPHEEMVDLVTHLSRETGIPVRDLLMHFGRHLFQRFAIVHPNHVLSYQSAFDLLRRLDGTIHVEVRKLYNDAELPSFTYEQLGDDRMTFIYSSHRKLADFAQGLIEGCIAHFDERMRIEREDLPEDQTGARTRFTLSRAANDNA
jgi:hypothetical protein